MKYSVCVDMMFSHLDFYDRIAEVKACGIDTIEFWKWSNKDIGKIKTLKESLDMNVSIFNIDSMDEKLSYDLSRGILNAGRWEDFCSALVESIFVYKSLGAKGMIVLIGETINEISYGEQIFNITKCLKKAAPIAEENGVTLLVEPLNAYDRLNYFMPYSKPLFDILNEVDSPSVKMLYDIYHQQMTEGHLLETIIQNIARIGHFHVADCPGRHEPGTGEINYINVIGGISRLDYNGYIGLEYRAVKPDSEAIKFTEEVEKCIKLR